MKYFVRILIENNPSRRCAVLEAASIGDEDYFYGSYKDTNEVLIFQNLKDAIDCANAFAKWYFPSLTPLLAQEPRSIEVVGLTNEQIVRAYYVLRSEDCLRGEIGDEVPQGVALARIASDLALELPLNPRAAAVVALVAEAVRHHNPPHGPHYDKLLDLARAALWQHPDRAPVRTSGAHWSKPRRRGP